MKSEVKKVSYRRHSRVDSRDRRRSKERHRSKVLIFGKGRK